MKIKCIGGPNDDEWHYTEGRNNIGEWIRVPEKQYTSAIMFNPDEAPTISTINFNIYIIDCFHFSRDDVYYFLRPSDWTNKQAMLHQFSKRCLNSSHGETGKRN